jgi:hypothetical protein
MLSPEGRRQGSRLRTAMAQSASRVAGNFRITEGKMDKLKTVVDKLVRIEDKHPERASVCTMCGKPAIQLVDGEPSCADHVEQVYEHQVEDYASKHLTDHAAREI